MHCPGLSAKGSWGWEYKVAQVAEAAYPRSFSLFQFNLFTSLRRLLCWAVGLSINIFRVLMGSLSCYTPATRSDKAGTSYQPTGIRSSPFLEESCLHLISQKNILPCYVTLWVFFAGASSNSEENSGSLWIVGKWTSKNMTSFRLEFHIWHWVVFYWQ